MGELGRSLSLSAARGFRFRSAVGGLLIVMASAMPVAGTPRAQISPVASDIRLIPPGTAQVVEIVRDGFGVPHVYAETTSGAAYGIGYVTAADKLWLMHILRILAEGRVADLLGPIPDAITSDNAARLSGYTDAERAAQFARLPDAVQRELRAFAEGVNRYIDEATADPEKLPLEFVTFGLMPLQRWDVDDTIAIWDLLAQTPASYPSGLRNTDLLARLIEADGNEVGRAKFDDLVRTTDPDTPVTVPEGAAWRGTSTGAPVGRLAELRTITGDARLSLAADAVEDVGARRSHEGRPAPSLPVQAHLAALERAVADSEPYAAEETGPFTVLSRKLFGSNATAVTPMLSETRNAAITAGPQTSYQVPASYYEFGVHVPGKWEATGVTLPGLLYHAIARTSQHAWTVTNGTSNAAIDWYQEELNPENVREYRFNDHYEPMECRTEVHTVRGVPYRTQEVCRTRHGPVLWSNQNVAYVQRKPWFDREELSAVAFRGLAQAQTFEDAALSVGLMSANFNVIYADENGRVAYWHAGFFPDRHDDADIRLVQPGDGSREWEGLLPFDLQPHVLDPERGWVASWNNEPASGWLEARAMPARQRVMLLERGFRDGANTPAPITGGTVNPDGRWSARDLAKNLEASAYGHVTYPAGCSDCAAGVPMWPFVGALPSADLLQDPTVKDARDVVAAWDGQAVDRDGNGRIESAAPLIMQTWIDVAVREAFADDLVAGDLQFARPNGEFWHVVSPNSHVAFAYDWLNGESRDDFVSRTFTMAVKQLAAAWGGTPASWKQGMGTARYTHYNHHLFLDVADGATCSATGGLCPRLLRDDLALDAARIGYVGPHDAMNRGRFNFVVAWQDPPNQPSGRVSACSINTPGNSQFLSSTGREGPWFRDQLELYTRWQWKAFPVVDPEVAAALEPTTCELSTGAGE